MSDSFFLDSNVCLYIFDNDLVKAATVKKLFPTGAVVSTQVLAETANVLVRDFLFGKEDAREAVRFIRNNTEVKSITAELFDIAFAVFIRYKFSFYDSMIVAAALDAHCSILYSEDMQHNQVIEHPDKTKAVKLTIINPFL